MNCPRAPGAAWLDKWSLWVLAELCSDGPLRFSRLLERLEGVSQKSLTATLRALERDGLITRTIVVQVPIRVDLRRDRAGENACPRSPTHLVVGSRKPCMHSQKTAADSIQDAQQSQLPTNQS